MVAAGLLLITGTGMVQAAHKRCHAELAACKADLAACEAQSCSVFPGDGASSGPALSYTDNGDGTATDNNTGFM